MLLKRIKNESLMIIIHFYKKGWSNNEELQQHGVQELNRILFAAIEQSLVNTKRAKLKQNLYRTYVSKIRCLTCLTVFEREVYYNNLPV